MSFSTFVLWLIILPSISTFELVDYSNESYALIPIEHAYLYRENGTLFHMFNVTEIEQKFIRYREMMYNLPELGNGRLALLMERCGEYLDQLALHRIKRGLNFLGTGIKFITGMPDHDDMLLVQQKLNDLIENNNHLAMINSHLQGSLEHLTDNTARHRVEILFEWLASELSQIIQTINLAKVGVLNTMVLGLQEVNRLTRTERNYSAPLMEVLGHSTLKILQVDSVYVLLIRYPRIEQKCMLYSVKSIERKMGKLKLEGNAAYCDNEYLVVRNCGRYVNANICSYSKHTCTQELLNGQNTKCLAVREHMPPIEEVGNGKILIHGEHKINSITRQGTFLVLFNGSITIDNLNFTNDEDLVLEYLQSNKPTQYEILEIIESQDANLKIPTLTIIEKIPIEIGTHPIQATIFLFIIVTVTIFLLHYFLRLCKLYNTYRIRKDVERRSALAGTLLAERLGTISFNGGRSYPQVLGDD